MCENNNPLGKVVSRAASIRNLNGKKVVRTIAGMKTIEDIPEYKSQIEKYVKECFGPNAEMKESEHGYYYLHRFWPKPKMHRITEGDITFRSKDFYFVENGSKVFGELKDAPDELVGSDTTWYEKGFIRIFKHPLGDRQLVYQLKE
jgi:hypothetical protein